jgi:hypothetical protein
MCVYIFGSYGVVVGTQQGEEKRKVERTPMKEK